jgi:WD40-like Beta Propeller Repeat
VLPEHLERHTRTRLTDSPDNEQNLTWGRNGQEVFYVTRHGGGGDLVRHTLGAAASATVIHSLSSDGGPCGVSPDGRWLAFFARRNNEIEESLWLLPLDGGEPKPFRIDRYPKGCTGSSLNGRWFAYQSGETGQAETYIESFPIPERRIQVTHDGSVESFWNGRGDELFTVDFSGCLSSVTVGSGPAPAISQPRVLFDKLNLGPAATVDGQRFLRVLPDPAAPARSITFLSPWLPARR